MNIKVHLRPAKIHLFVLLLASMLQSTHGQDEFNTCHVQSVPRGNPTTVTCNFYADISTLTKPVSVSVEWYPAQSTNTILVMECTWLKEGNLRCNPKPGFHYLGFSGRQMSVNISQASEEHEGNYTCKVMSKDAPVSGETCPFRLKPTDKYDVVSAVPPPPKRFLPPVEKKQTKATKEEETEEEEGGNIGLIIGLVIGALCIIGLLVLGVVFRKRLKSQFCKDDKNYKDPTEIVHSDNNGDITQGPKEPLLQPEDETKVESISGVTVQTSQSVPNPTDLAETERKEHTIKAEVSDLDPDLKDASVLDPDLKEASDLDPDLKEASDLDPDLKEASDLDQTNDPEPKPPELSDLAPKDQEASNAPSDGLNRAVEVEIIAAAPSKEETSQFKLSSDQDVNPAMDHEDIGLTQSPGEGRSKVTEASVDVEEENYKSSEAEGDKEREALLKIKGEAKPQDELDMTYLDSDDEGDKKKKRQSTAERNLQQRLSGLKQTERGRRILSGETPTSEKTLQHMGNNE